MSEELDRPYNATRCPFCKSLNTILLVPHGHEIKRLAVERYWKMWCSDCLGDFMIDVESKSRKNRQKRKKSRWLEWEGQMSELKVIDVDKMADVRSLSGRFYRKSEADKVIAELKESVKKLILDNYLKTKELRRQKYKRCLDKAEMCEAKYDAEDAKVNDGLSWEYISTEMKYWERWRWRWDALAEKFKEEK